MFKYRNASSRRLWIRRVGVTVDPGEVFESPFEITYSTFERVKDEAKKAAQPGTPAKED